MKMSREVKNIRLKRKHGKNIIDDFTTGILNEDVSLSTLAIKYGFTRERARQLYNQLNSSPYSLISQEKRMKNKAHKEANRIDPSKKLEKSKGDNPVHKGTRKEIHLYKTCKNLNLTIIPLYDKVDFEINGRKVEFKSCFASKKVSNKRERKYYHFSGLTKNEWKHLDYLICLVVPTNKFFIIPKSSIKSRSGIFIPDLSSPLKRHDLKESRFLQFEEDWDSLIN